MLPYGRKILCRSPFFEAVTALRFSPDYLTRERQEFKEEGKPQVSLPFCPCGGCRTLPRSAERSSPLRFSEKLPAHQGRTRLRQFVCPGQPVQQKEPPVRGEPACGSSCALASQCSKRSRPDWSNPPAAVRVPWSPCAEKRKAPQNCFHGAQSMHFYSKRSSVSTSLRAGACGSCAG